MDLIGTYVSSSSDNATEEIGRRDVRQVYLVTYSQADINKFPTRQSFAEAVNASFRAPSAEVLQWCCSKEPRKSSGVHYRLCLKLNKMQRWLPAKRYLKEHFNISVHFSSAHSNYYTAWKYVTKKDEHVVQSENHPDRNSIGPRTTKAHNAKAEIRIRKREREEASAEVISTSPLQSEDDVNEDVEVEEGDGESEGKRRCKRLRPFDVSRIILAQNIKCRIDLLALAHQQKSEGKTDLAEFIVNRGNKAVNELIATSWDMETATETQIRSKKTRLELLGEAGECECVCEPRNEWHVCATTLLENNRISCDQFAQSVRELMGKGRGKVSQHHPDRTG